MTPNPDSPIFIKHEVPDYACNNSKKLSLYFFLLRGEIRENRWNGISVNDISLTYNTYDGCTEVEVVFRDKNNHAHHFTMQLVPANGFGDTDEDRFRLLYLFEGKFDENALSIRSFAAYLAIHLEYEGFEPTLMKCDKGLDIPCSVESAYDGICKLIDITQSNIKPLAWFYTKEPNIKSFEGMCYYLTGVKSRLQIECCNGRWNKVDPECFKLEIYNEEKEVALQVAYIVDDVWDLSLSANAAQYEGYFDLSCTFNCYPETNLSDEVKRMLDGLFADFLSSLKIAKGNRYIGCGDRRNHSISIQYFHIEDTFDLLCKMLDEIVPALQNFTFRLPLQPINLTGEIETIKEQMEAALNTTLEVITEEERINKKLQCGYFKT